MLNKYRSAINPPYSRRDLPAILGTVLVLLSLFSIILLIQQVNKQQTYKSKAESADIIYPPNSGMVNVKDHGVIGDGITDDTQALLTLMHNTRNVSQTNMLYFPPGTYLVSNVLDWKNSSGVYYPYMSFYGAGEKKTIIKLIDNAPGYSDKTVPKAVIYTASFTLANNTTTGNGNEAYHNNIEDLSVDTGKGNPGAIGISWQANNRGTMKNVTITAGDGEGFRGIDLTRPEIGPCLLKNVTVNGFDYGIDVGWYDQTATMEFVTLNNQKIYGLRDKNQPIFIRKLTSNNSVPAFNLSGATALGNYALLTLIDSTLNGIGTASSKSAIETLPGSDVFARNVTTPGYASAIKNATTTLVSGTTINEYETQGPFELFPSTKKSLNLPIKETPEVFYTNDMSQWANVVDYGAVPNAASLNYDSGPGIQKAIDSGKPIVYLPEGRYYTSNTIIIRGNVKVIYGFFAEVYSTFNGGVFIDASNPHPLFRYEGTTNDLVTMHNMRLNTEYGQTNAPGLIALEYATSKNLLLDQMSFAGTAKDYINHPGAGELYLQDVQVGRLWLDNPQNVWARQLNPEVPYTRIINHGGKVWVMGMKTEKDEHIADTLDGGWTEIIGAAYYPNDAANLQPGETAFTVVDSHFSASFVVGVQWQQPTYDILVEETQNGITKNFTKQMAPTRGYGSMVPLYVGSLLSITTPTSILATPTNTPVPTATPTRTPTPTKIPSTDTTKPTVSISSPLNGATVARKSNVTINATAIDNVGVDHVTFSVAGNTSTDYSTPYSYAWSVPPGKPRTAYTITATAYDESNNSAVSQITVKSNK